MQTFIGKEVLQKRNFIHFEFIFFIFYILSPSVYLLLVPFASTVTTTCPVILHLINALLHCYSLPMLIPHLLVSLLPQS